MGRRGRRRKQLLDDLLESCKLKGQALGRSAQCSTRSVRG